MAKPRPYPGPQWEFKVRRLPVGGPTLLQSITLGDEGAQGWQLVGVTRDPVDGQECLFYFQRRYIEQLTGERPRPSLPD